MTQRVSFIYLALFVSSLLIDKPKLGSVATNRFVYRKLLGGLGGFYPVPFGVPLWVSFTDFGFCIRKFTNPFAGKLQFPNLDFKFAASLFCVDSLFTFHDVVTCF